jgi:hypothetical protein
MHLNHFAHRHRIVAIALGVAVVFAAALLAPPQANGIFP